METQSSSTSRFDGFCPASIGRSIALVRAVSCPRDIHGHTSPGRLSDGGCYQEATMANGTEQSAKEFISRLRAGSIRPPLALIGMVKASDNSEHALMFSAAGCEDWIELPESAIAAIETLGTAPCKDHQHPRVRIELALSDDRTVSALASVLMQLMSSVRSAGRITLAERHSAVAYSHAPEHTGTRHMGRIEGRRYFRLFPFDVDFCPSDHPICVGGVSSCPRGCACCDGGGECFCSTCCIS
jgi:hypothetical protein